MVLGLTPLISSRVKKTVKPAQASTQTFHTSALVSSLTLARIRTTLTLKIHIMPPNPIPEINPPSQSNLALKKVHWRATHDKWEETKVVCRIKGILSVWEEQSRCDIAVQSWCTVGLVANYAKICRCWNPVATKRIWQQRNLRAKWPDGGPKRSMKDLTRVSKFKSLTKF